jgi:hypothetical protein
MTRQSMPYIPFSQRTGLEPIPPQLNLGEVSPELRRLLYYYVSLELDRETQHFDFSAIIKDKWLRVATDLHVLFLGQPIDTFNNDAYKYSKTLNALIQNSTVGRLLNFVEFLVRHPGCSDELKDELASAFVTARAAYRVVDNECVVAIGSEEQAAAIELAIAEAETKNATAARKQLLAAGVALRNSDWAGCVRESIHAVEAMAVRLAPEPDYRAPRRRGTPVEEGSTQRVVDLLW